MSTAIERVMRERGDFDCVHEPFLHHYYLQRSTRALPHFDSAQDHPLSYEDTRDLLLQRAEKAPVFAKDMSYYVMPEILQDEEFCRRVRHCFLIRNPLLSIMSYYKLDAEVELDEIGLEAQWRHLQGLQKLDITNSVVLEAEAVQADTEQAMRLFWQALDLDYNQKALSWEQESTPQDWQYVQGWHQSVSGSQGIREPSASEMEQAQEEFDQLCERLPRLKEFLRHHLPFYERLKEYSVTRA
jgi:hypothetical protein